MTARELVSTTARVLLQAREPALAPLRPLAVPRASPSPRVSVSRPFGGRTALGASFAVLWVPRVPVPVPVPVRGPRVWLHAVPLLQLISFSPF